MATNWTKGPYQISERDGFTDVIARVPNSFDTITVATVRYKDDAQRFAAVDDLYDALNRLIADLPIRRDWLDPDLERYAKDALAKARGESA